MPTATISERLKRAPLFQDLPVSELEQLAGQVRERRLENGEVLFRRNEPGGALYIIDEGWIRIVTDDAEGKQLVLNKCGPGEVVGEMSLFDSEPRSAGAVAEGPVTVLELKHEDFRNVLDQQPELALLIIRKLSERLRFSTRYLEKAIEWSRRIAAGDYSMALNQIRSSQEGFQSESDEARASELLAAFFQMVDEVRAREEALRQQLRVLTTEIDEVKRRQEVEAISSTGFYKKLREDAARLRRERAEDSEP